MAKQNVKAKEGQTEKTARKLQASRVATAASAEAQRTGAPSQQVNKQIWTEAITSLKSRHYASLDEARGALVDTVNTQLKLSLNAEDKRNLTFVLSLDLTLDELLQKELEVNV